ncbi:helix-turn-helix domain-containing protein [Streptomyces phage Alderaan]|nr:helix-turn-helix domain-containing protein [Streptomyces phage Alderaan]
MARIRTIKPDFFTSLTIADLTIEQRLTFIGLWTHCDDQGRAVDDARLIKAALWPLDDRTAADVETDLAALSESSLIVRYTFTGKRYLAVSGWKEHQRINRPSASRLPAPDQGDSAPESPLTSGDEGSEQPHAHLSEDSPQERNREQGTGKGTGNREPSALAPRDPDPDPVREDVERLCEHLADRIVQNGSNRPNITKGWRDAARLMLDKDGRTEEQVHGAIDWCQDSDFWRSNVMSMPKLRDKYDTLRLQASRPAAGGNVVPINRPSTTDQRVAEGLDLAARLRAQEAAQ